MALKVAKTKTTRQTPTMPETQETTREKIEDFLDEAEQELIDLDRKLKGQVGEARLQAHLGIVELEKRWDKLLEGLARRKWSVATAGAKAQGLVDEAQVQAHLAKMDTKDAAERLGRRIEKLRAEALRLKADTGVECQRILERIAQAFKDATLTH